MGQHAAAYTPMAQGNAMEHLGRQQAHEFSILLHGGISLSLFFFFESYGGISNITESTQLSIEPNYCDLIEPNGCREHAYVKSSSLPMVNHADRLTDTTTHAASNIREHFPVITDT